MTEPLVGTFVRCEILDNPWSAPGYDNMLKVIICQSNMLRLSPKHLRLVQMEFYNTKQIQQENYQYQTKYKHS